MARERGYGVAVVCFVVGFEELDVAGRRPTFESRKS